MIRFSSRAEKISWISIFSLMLVIIIGLSVGLAVVSSKDEEDWDVVTKDYAYKTIYVTDADYPLAAKAYIKIKNLSSEYQNYTFDIKLYNKSDNSVVYGYSAYYSSQDDYTTDSTKDFVTFTGPINYLPPHETTLIPIGLNSIDNKIDLKKCYCLISKFEIDESKDNPNSY